MRQKRQPSVVVNIGRRNGDSDSRAVFSSVGSHVYLVIYDTISKDEEKEEMSKAEGRPRVEKCGMGAKKV